MQKEVHEQPKALAAAMRGRLIINKPYTPSRSAGNLFTTLSSASLTALDSATIGAAVFASGGSTGRRSNDSGTGSDGSAASGMSGASGMSRASSGSLLRVKKASAPKSTIRMAGLEAHKEAIKRCRRVLLIACGTSFHSCMAVRKTVEDFTGMPVTLELATDLMDREAPVFRDDMCVFVSQSGETSGTLRALDYAKAKGALCVGITNTAGSAISRNTHCGVHINAGHEIGDASSKAYTSQMLVMTMVALMLAEDSSALAAKRSKVIKELETLPAKVELAALKLDGAMKELAGKLKDVKSLLFFARGYNYATALEAALKMKEVARVHSEGINAGEMKHGPLALVDADMPIVVVATRDSMYGKMQSVIQQLLARSARLIILCNENDPVMQGFAKRGKCDLIEVLVTQECLAPIVNIVPLQLLAYHLAMIRGYDVDQPRNPAKGVTMTED